MRHKTMRYIFLLHLFVLYYTAFKSDANLKLEDELRKGCDNKVTAACDSLRGDGTVYLFSGRSAFVFDPQKKTVIDVLSTYDEVGNVSFPIDSAAASKRYYFTKDFIVMTKGDTAYAFINTTDGKKGVYGGHGTIKSLDNHQGIEVQTGEGPECMAAACYKDDKSCDFWRIFNNHQDTTKVFHCRSTGSKPVPCEYSHVFKAPRWMSQDILDDLSKTKCEAMAITVNDDEQETALTFIDSKDELHYYVNDKKLYSKSMGGIFNCPFFLTTATFLIAAVSTLIVVVIAIPLAILFVVKTKRPAINEEDVVTNTQLSKGK